MTNEEQLEQMLSDEYDKGYNKAKEEIERLKQWNLYYYSLICAYADTEDEIENASSYFSGIYYDQLLNKFKKLNDILHKERDKFKNYAGTRIIDVIAANENV